MKSLKSKLDKFRKCTVQSYKIPNSKSPKIALSKGMSINQKTGYIKNDTHDEKFIDINFHHNISIELKQEILRMVYNKLVDNKKYEVHVFTFDCIAKFGYDFPEDSYFFDTDIEALDCMKSIVENDVSGIYICQLVQNDFN